MKPEIKKMWVEALRSGEFEQGQHALCTIEEPRVEYCCLGVLTELFQEHHPDEKLNQEYTYATYNVGRKVNVKIKVYDGHENLLHPKVVEWAGLDSEDPEVYTHDDQECKNPLSEINDEGADFEEIANLIEDQL
jgi:hypothetical protein